MHPSSKCITPVASNFKTYFPEKLPEAGPKIDDQMSGMSGAVADWMDKNQDRLLARRPGEGFWAHETRRAKVTNSYFSLRVEECKTRTGWKSYIACGYYHTRKVTSGTAAALGENTASTLADFTPIVGEFKYGKEVLTGEQEFTALGAIGSVSIFKPLKVFRLARAGNLMKKMGKMLELVKFSRPVKIVKNAKFFPSQNIASRTHVAGYATIMKAGLWDWSRAGKITYSMDKGKRVIVNGHHRYMAAKMAGVKIPKEAFRLTKDPAKMRIAFDWDKMSWGNSLHATRDFKEILAQL